MSEVIKERQRTIGQEIHFKGVGLHTGHEASVCLKPAAARAGIKFIRTDLPGAPVIEAHVDNILRDPQVPRCTSIGKSGALVYTIEHFMGVLCGLGIDNIIVEIDNDEMPGLDGSGLEYFNAIKEQGIVELEAEKEYLEIKETIGVYSQNASIYVVPDKEYRISYLLDYNHPYLNSQFFSTRIDVESFEKNIAPCRTFCLETEAEELLSRGLGKGANYSNTLVVGKSGVIKNQVRFQDEFARHKVLDFIGDLYLLAKPIRGHVFAIKSGHDLNISLIKKIAQQQKRSAAKPFVPSLPAHLGQELSIQQIMSILPHRYPFLLVDRIVELEKGKRAVGIKNVTVNEDFFNGHFPQKPIMPGVLMIEAMAQVGGIVVLTNEAHAGKLGLFMATDNVKFRRMVVPGDQLRLEVEVIRDRARTAILHGQTKVRDEVVAEADIVISFVNASFLESDEQI